MMEEEAGHGAAIIAGQTGPGSDARTRRHGNDDWEQPDEPDERAWDG